MGEGERELPVAGRWVVKGETEGSRRWESRAQGTYGPLQVPDTAVPPPSMHEQSAKPEA